jgi:hypothetical protein
MKEPPMALTSSSIPVPETAIPVPHPHRLRAVLGWAAVVVALAIASVLLVAALQSGDADTVPHTGLVERGSITAIDHGGSVGVRTTAGDSMIERGSITAIDRAAERTGG